MKTIKNKIELKKFITAVGLYFKNNVLFVTFVLTAVLNSTLLRIFTLGTSGSIKPFLADLFLIMLIGTIGYAFKRKGRFRFYLIMSIIFTFICVANSLYFTNYNDFASFAMLPTTLQLIDVADAVVENVLEMKDFIYLLEPIVLIFVYRSLKKNDKYIEYKDKENKIAFAKKTLIVSLIPFIWCLLLVTTTDLNRLARQWNKKSIVSEFGIYIYQINDIFASTKASLRTVFGADKATKEFYEYYEKNNYVPKNNKYTEIFKDKNVLVLHAESIQSFLIGTRINGREITPNLNKLANEGLYFSNYYSQSSSGTSSDSEFTLSTSLLPAASGTVAISYWDREYVTIQKLLKEKGYYTFSMHGNDCSFWNRDKLHKSLGYDDFYCSNKDYVIDEVVGLGLSDSSFFKQSTTKIEEIKNKHGKFYGVLIMLSNHTPFTDAASLSDLDLTMQYKMVNEETGVLETLTAPYLEDTKMGNYIKSVNYADKAIGEFINELDAKNLLDNTVIVVYGDHDAKIKKTEYERYYNYDPVNDDILDEDDENYYEIDQYSYELMQNVPFIIWTKGSRNNADLNNTITQVMGTYDVLPTLGNMLGIYSKYALGHDIFSVKDNIVVFPDSSWLTNKLYYNSQKEEGKLLDTNNIVSTEYIAENTKHTDEVLSISDKIIVYDLIKIARDRIEINE